MDIDTILLDAEERMGKAVASLDKDFSKLRTGRATTALVAAASPSSLGTRTASRPLKRPSSSRISA